MDKIFFTAANAVLPIILLILLGYILKQTGILTDGFLKPANKIVFTLCIPAMLFVNVYSIESVQAMRWDVVVYCGVITLVLFVLGLITAVLTTREENRRGVILQCVFRSNFSIIGLSLAAAVGGAEAEAVAAVVSAFLVPLFNALAVIALAMFNKKDKGHHVVNILKGIATNPLIIGTLAALACVLLRQLQTELWGSTVFTIKDQLPFLFKVLTHLKNCTTPLALLVMGGQFAFTAAKQLRKEIIVGTVWRIVIAPALGVGVAILLSRCTDLIRFGPAEYPTLVALFGSPVAVSNAAMAQQMGGDEQLATQYVVWSSIFSVVTVFLLVSGLLAAGLLAA